jgi:hypothetical protein
VASAGIATALLWLVVFSTASAQVIIMPPSPLIVVTPPTPLSNKPTTIVLFWFSSDDCYPRYLSHEMKDHVITVETDFSPSGRECILGAPYSAFSVDAGILPAGSYDIVVRGEFRGTLENFGSLTFDVVESGSLPSDGVESDSVLFLPAVAKPRA